MKKLLFIVLLSLAPTSVYAQLNPKEWNTEGIKTNPAISTALAQYVAPTDETKTFHFIIASSVTTLVFLEQIGSDGSAVIRTQAYVVNAFLNFEGMKQLITLAANERIRIRTSTAITGQIQCSIYIDN